MSRVGIDVASLAVRRCAGNVFCFFCGGKGLNLRPLSEDEVAAMSACWGCVRVFWRKIGVSLGIPKEPKTQRVAGRRDSGLGAVTTKHSIFVPDFQPPFSRCFTQDTRSVCRDPTMAEVGKGVHERPAQAMRDVYKRWQRAKPKELAKRHPDLHHAVTRKASALLASPPISPKTIFEAFTGRSSEASTLLPEPEICEVPGKALLLRQISRHF